MQYSYKAKTEVHIRMRGGITMRLAIYGKGGIGKSTIASNLSVGLAAKGKKVLHIGCDPKGDSCRAIMGREIPDFVQVLGEKGSTMTPEDIIFTGLNGVSCLEVGGPKGGSGCAGMGMNAMNAMLEQFGIWQENWDYIVYDVLGDVVCSGFSTAMREGYADLVYIVTSAEYMSFYAANSLVRALREIGNGKSNFGGFIFNRCQNNWEEEVLPEFLRWTNGQEAGRIPMSSEIRNADYAQVPVLKLQEKNQDSEVMAAFAQLLKRVEDGKGCVPSPLSAEELAEFRRFCLEKEREWHGTSKG